MRHLLAEARGAGVSVRAMGVSAPVALFVVDGTVLYRPTGCARADANLVRQGLAVALAVGDTEPLSGTFFQGQTPTGTDG